jgi:type 1 fimbria pilin
MRKRKPLLITLNLLASVILVASIAVAPVLAASLHFIGTPTITKNSNFSVTAKFRAAGLGSEVTRVIMFSGNVTATLQCVNPDGNNPPPKRVSFGTLSGADFFQQTSNGQIIGTISVGPPPFPSASQICPNPSWDVKVVSLTYTGVRLTLDQPDGDHVSFNFGTVTFP